ncbi:MAG: hypothetical protein J0M12_04485 [Deltaproteobacteria bacterium]|nr:hypothetical protein [Deltaproteobacteria bacterium]
MSTLSRPIPSAGPFPAPAEQRDAPASEASAPLEASLPSRGIRRTAAIAALVGVAGIFGVDSSYRSSRSQEYEATWGSLSMPAFTPQDLTPGVMSKTFAQSLLEQRERYAARMDFLSGLSQETDRLSEKISALEKNRSGIHEISAIQQETDRIRTILRPASSAPLISSAELSAQFEATHGDVVSYAKELFHRVTGKQVPSSVVFTDSQLRTDRGGEIENFSQNVRYTKGEYAANLRTILHELGHAVYLGSETNESGWVPFGLGASTRNSMLLEECAAELFYLAAASYIEDPLLRKETGPLDSERIQDWLTGAPDTSHHHNEGFSLSDAYLELAGGNASAAYRMATASTSIDPRALAIVERNREMLRTGLSPTEMSERMLAAHSQLLKTVDALAERTSALTRTQALSKADGDK